MKNKPESWIEVTIPCSGESVEAIANFLFENGASGTEERSDRLLGFFPEPADPEKLTGILKPYLRILNDLGFEVGEATIRRVGQEDWGRKWRENFTCIQVTPSLYIKPPWEEKPKAEGIVIDIMPRMAFGTGSHETTRLCLEFMQSVLEAGNSVLDIGTGSGILAIGAAKMGAGQIEAVEIDADAIDNVYENAKLNDVADRIRVSLGSLEVVPKMKYDLIIANINRSVLEKIVPKLDVYTHPDTRIILSGILDTEEALIENMLSELKLMVLKKRKLGEWLAYTIRKS